MAYAAGDIPEVADVLINGEIYMLYEAQELRGSSSYSPLFVPRENVQGDYGDAQFDFWMTFSQNDWSGGMGQRYLRVNDPASRNQFWVGDQIDISRPGEARIAIDTEETTATAAVQGMASTSEDIVWTTTTNAYRITSGTSETDLGAHGLGTSALAVAIDGGRDVYVSSATASNLIRRHVSGTTWETWSTSEAGALAYHNNALYGFHETDRTLLEYDTAGAATTIHTFTEADGGTFILGTPFLVSFGSKLILVLTTPTLSEAGTEIWEYDGVGVTRIAQLPRNFRTTGVTTSLGSLFLSGTFLRDGPTEAFKSAIIVVSGGGWNVLWEDPEWGDESVGGGVVAWDNRIWWMYRNEDLGIDSLVSYDPRTGAVSPEATGEVFSTQIANHGLLGANKNYIVSLKKGSTNVSMFPHTSGTVQTTGRVFTSLFDGDSSLQKHWESVQVEFDSASDGDGGSVDIARAFDSLANGDYVSVQTGATSGTEYKIDAASREISIRVSLKKGTSTLGPVLKAIRVRGAPINPSFRKERYVLNLHGVDGQQHVKLRNGQLHPKDGLEMATDLRTAFTSGDDFSVTDEFGTYNAVFEPGGLRLERTRSQEYVAVVELRES